MIEQVPVMQLPLSKQSGYVVCIWDGCDYSAVVEAITSALSLVASGVREVS